MAFRLDMNGLVEMEVSDIDAISIWTLLFLILGYRHDVFLDPKS